VFRWPNISRPRAKVRECTPTEKPSDDRRCYHLNHLTAFLPFPLSLTLISSQCQSDRFRQLIKPAPNYLQSMKWFYSLSSLFWFWLWIIWGERIELNRIKAMVIIGQRNGTDLKDNLSYSNRFVEKSDPLPNCPTAKLENTNFRTEKREFIIDSCVDATWFNQQIDNFQQSINQSNKSCYRAVNRWKKHSYARKPTKKREREREKKTRRNCRRGKRNARGVQFSNWPPDGASVSVPWGEHIQMLDNTRRIVMDYH